ncbi:hypothetical protein KCP77_07375 [Salmonella enterica subsp. enterica]|nr:hypothetical protein KCP77_07375 [Salmonella enterica subsp. enterica]
MAGGTRKIRRVWAGAALTAGEPSPAFSTDSYVIDRSLFPGGNIGKLAICGTACADSQR